MQDLSKLKQLNVKLHQDSDAIVQGTKATNNPMNTVIRRIARDIRELCADLDQKIANANQTIQSNIQQNKYM